jgi:hypothetical protein
VGREMGKRDEFTVSGVNKIHAFLSFMGMVQSEEG